MEARHAQATRRSGDLGISPVSETRKLAAILVADIVGYSRLAGADEDRILARLRTLRSDLIDPILAVHHGRVVKRTGDGAIIEFRSVVDAVRCAIEVQSGLAERNAGLPPEKRIEYRVGIHLGDVVEEDDGDLMGDGVNIASRLEGVAKPGTICLSEQAYWQVKGRLDLKVTDLGNTQLKNIAEPIHVYSLEVGQPAQAKPAKPAEPVTPDPKGDMKRADELVSKALALDPDDAGAHHMKGNILQTEGRTEEAVAEHERALTIDPSMADTAANLGVDYLFLGDFDKSIEYADKAIRMSVYDPSLLYWYGIKAWADLGLKRYDRAIDWARRSIAINPNYFPDAHVILVAALALADRDVEAREALQQYLALPSSASLKTIAAWNARYRSKVSEQHPDPRFLEMNERSYEGLRKAGMPEE
jgi:class 3 adenylate cyclase/Flp pilus assembly protein TadD